jgi:molecular chaperone DnaK
MDGARYLGIDLGTTNTAAAVFDGDRVEMVRTTDGGTLTPSVVRIDGRGRVTVGQRARPFLEKDPDNTRSEFKRLMGTGRTLPFAVANVARRPEELAAEVLRSVRSDVSEMLGFTPARAVLTVPALFELPQAGATSEAARLAGFEQVELLQEPVASALAAGWSAEDDGGGAWLVYDLGGGTFDVSLLETREGLLRVVGHDGDNFLGGRDIDTALVGWALEQLAQEGLHVDRGDPRHATALRVLRAAAEQAKIDLTRREEAELTAPELFEVGGSRHDVELVLHRATLEQFVAPVVERSIGVCRRLLGEHGLVPSQLRKVVLVGGPTVIPYLRHRLTEAFGVPFAEGLDPMSLVARGAALYAATAGLDAQSSGTKEREVAPSVRRLWLQYPAMTADTSPFVAGRVLEGPGPQPAEVRFVRQDGGFESPFTRVGADKGLVVMLELMPRRQSTFRIEARDAAGAAVPVEPKTISLVHGLSVGEPPLSRSVGVALADDSVQVYVARGTPLPAKRTFVHHTVDTVLPGSQGEVVAIPIVQGELHEAHLCRLVGRLSIPADRLGAALPAGSPVEVTVEVDRGGKLSARALIPRLDQVFEQVAHLSIPEADPEALGTQLVALRARTAEVRPKLITDPRLLDRLLDVDWALADAEASLTQARGGDADAAQKSRRLLIDAEAILSELEDGAAWPELDERAVRQLASASRWVSQLGTPQEQRMLDETSTAVERARRARNATDLDRYLGVVRQLTNAAYYRHPDAWRWDFQHAASDVSRATDLERAMSLVADGHKAVAAGDRDQLRRVVQELWKLLPDPPAALGGGYASGVR